MLGLNDAILIISTVHGIRAANASKRKLNSGTDGAVMLGMKEMNYSGVKYYN